MKKEIIAIYSILLGIAVILLWIILLRSNDIPEGKTEMTFHLFSELLMAVLCILSGIKMLLNNHQAYNLNLMAHGMVIYSVLNAAGFYGERGEFAMMIMFITLLIISFLIIVRHLSVNLRIG